MLNDDIEANCAQFFSEATDTGCVWALESGQGWAQCASEKYSETRVIPFWSHPEYAEIHTNGDWSHHQVIAISLEEFLEDWLPGMHKDVILVGINWGSDLDGEEYEPLDLLEAFERALA